MMIIVKPIKYVWKTLFNNAAVYEGRKRKWYESLIIFLLAIIIALIPTIVNVTGVKGSSVLDSNTNGIDLALKDFSSDLSDKGIKFTIVENDDTESSYKKVLSIDGTWSYGEKGFVSTRNDGNETVSRLKVLYFNETAKDMQEKFNAVLKQVYNPDSDKEEEKAPIVSHLILGKENACLIVYSKNATDWAKPTATRSLNYVAFDKDVEVMSNYNNEQYLKNWKSFLDKGYSNVKTTYLFAQMGIYTGINVLVSLFFALILFILTRGKKNPFREIKFYEMLKMVGVASLCPALVSCLLGFIMPAYSSLLFMFTLGLRVMWMSTNTLSPYKQQAK